MTALRSQDEIRNTVVSLGLPEHPYFMRRTARAMDLLDTGKVNFVGDEIFRVHSQFDDQIYHVELNHGLPPRCDCADYQKNPGVSCKHIISSLLYSQRQQAKSTVKVTWDDTENSYHKRGRWWVTDYKERIKYVIYRDGDGNLICPCGRKPDCEHRKAIREYLNNNDDGNDSKITVDRACTSGLLNECGSERAKEIQDKLNGQSDSLQDNGNGNGAYYAPSQIQLDISDPFQESESLDIEQIEGRKNGELAWKLGNGEYVISYAGVMKLAEKHNIEFSVSLHDDTNTVIAKAMNGNERISGKEVKICGFAKQAGLSPQITITASELAKRNAARQLLPYAELKAVEHKAKLEAEFDWQTAYAKCVELVGTKAILDCIIHDLVNWGKLRQDNPSHYDRTEWLLIHEYCQKEASISRDPGSTNNWSYNSAVFISRCKEAIQQVREKKSIEANELPMVICGDKPACTQNGDGKRKLQMDKKLKTWLIETDGTKKAISCREICEQFSDGSIITRLRAGIDSGADISTVELD